MTKPDVIREVINDIVKNIETKSKAYSHTQSVNYPYVAGALKSVLFTAMERLTEKDILDMRNIHGIN